MDYVVGNVAALISGNVTPSRPKLSKRALTPTKHMPSPNVTPKSELVDDRSIFLSPSVQKKKAIVKKSPKRIFQNPEFDVTNEIEGNTSTNSPKADKVKKHLKDELEATVSPKNNSKTAKALEGMHSKPVESPSPKKKSMNGNLNDSVGNNISSNELTPKKKKKRNTEASQSVCESIESKQGTPKKSKKQKVLTLDNTVQNDSQEDSTNVDVNTSVKASKKKKKNKNKLQTVETEQIEEPQDDDSDNETESTSKKKKNKKRKKLVETQEHNEDDCPPVKNKKIKVNPNAITDKDSDSEHESDDEIESETEETNKKVLENSVQAESSSDEEETPAPKKKKKEESQETEKVREVNTEEEVKRTLFVGNVPFSKKCKKEIKKLFSHYGQIESVRIRTVPVKDPSVTPKLAVIKQELHPERSTVNVYVKFSDPESVDQALVENNTVLNNNNLRVTRSGDTGAEHDPRHSVFVGNIPFALEDQGLREKFQGCGDIESVRIVRDKKTNAGKGFGYVNFTSRDGVELALALTDEDLTIKNRIMRVKRCTQATQRQAQRGTSNRDGFQGKNKVSQGDRQRNQGAGKPPGRNFNQGGKFQGNRGGNNFRGNRGGSNFQGNRGGFQGNRGGFQGNRGGFQGNRGGSQGNRGGFQGNRGNFQNRGGNSVGRQNDGEKQDGAYRRLQHKRKSEEGGDGPPNKVARDDQPREKKARKEFVGMTAEKKKKRKFDKGQKKKKALSEILTK